MVIFEDKKECVLSDHATDSPSRRHILRRTSVCHWPPGSQLALDLNSQIDQAFMYWHLG